MTTDLALRQPPEWESQLDVIRRNYAPDATDKEFELYLYKARRYGLEPGTQIHFTKRSNRMAIITAIDGYRLLAERSGQYAGNDDAVFGPDVDVDWDFQASNGSRDRGHIAAPSSATVTVWKLLQGHRCPFTATARWSEYYPGDRQGYTWRKMPHVMLAKCAEALALRKAFPAELSGLYTDAEMAQAGQSLPTRVVDMATGEIMEETPATAPPVLEGEAREIAPQRDSVAPAATVAPGAGPAPQPAQHAIFDALGLSPLGGEEFVCEGCGEARASVKLKDGQVLPARDWLAFLLDKKIETPVCNGCAVKVLAERKAAKA